MANTDAKIAEAKRIILGITAIVGGKVTLIHWKFNKIIQIKHSEMKEIYIFN